MIKRLSFGVVLAALWALPASALTVQVTPWLAPNAYGSPSFAAAEANAVQAMYNGLSTYGASGPTQFQANSNVTSAEAIVTGFPSWMGQTDPGTVFGPAYANELGNRMTFALGIVASVDQQISISELSFSATSTDPYNALAFGWAAGSYNYGTGYMGVLKGADGILGTADDVFITSGPSTQLVDAIFGRGSGNSFDAYCTSCSLADQQAALNASAAYPGTPFQFTGTYSIEGVSGSGTFNVSPTPLPAALPLFVTGLGALGLLGWRRKRKNAASSLAA